mgnify:CR=1 FL=1
MNSNQRIHQHFEEAAQVLERVRHDESLIQAIAQSGQRLIDTLAGGGKIISCGNGGSMSDAMHFAEELSGRYREDRPGLAAIACSDPSHITCVGNDYGFDQVFARELTGVAKAHDVFIPISTSGTSLNILTAVEQAKLLGLAPVALTGLGGGKLADLCECIRVPSNETARIQECHILIGHIICGLVEHHYFKDTQ